MGEAQVIRSVTSGKHPPRLQEPRLGDVAWDLIECCWATDPKDRVTMAEVLNIMDAIQPGKQYEIQTQACRQKSVDLPVDSR